ncbi:MAG: hypothetical protein WKF58_10235 [Ilumatobacteraceae bacterium]
MAPSNPILSIAPIRSLAGVDATLARRRDSVVAVSPIVGGAALKGPADRVLEGLGHESSVVGVAALYSRHRRHARHRPRRRSPRRRRRGAGNARRRDAVGDELARALSRPRHRRARRCRRAARAASTVSPMPSTSDVHGDHARWMRARTGDTANLPGSPQRPGPGSAARPSGVTSL